MMKIHSLYYVVRTFEGLPGLLRRQRRGESVQDLGNETYHNNSNIYDNLKINISLILSTRLFSIIMLNVGTT